jgi:hypothetical protein
MTYLLFSFLLLVQKKRNKEKDSFSEEFFFLQSKTGYKTPRRPSKNVRLNLGAFESYSAEKQPSQ